MEEINEKSKQYKQQKYLGGGGGGKVNLCLDLVNNREVVVKSGLVKESQMGVGMDDLREIKFFMELSAANHPNIMKLYDVFFEKGSVHFVMEYCKGDLSALIANTNMKLEIADIKAILYDILSPLQYIHSRYIAHRDIKPENYLVGKDKRLRLSDFGSSRYVGTPRDCYSSKVCTLFYRAPEILMQAPLYTTAVDMWSVGCILGSLLLRAPLFLGKDEVEVLYAIFYFLGTPTKKDWPGVENLPGYVEFNETFKQQNHRKMFPNAPDDVLDLLYKMLVYDPKQRITVDEALQHPFFTNLPAKTPFEDIPYWI